MAVTLLLLTVISLLLFTRFVSNPMALQSAQDASGLLVLSAQTWAELPPETRSDFEMELEYSHNIILREDSSALAPVDSHQPYLNLLQEALSQRMAQSVEIGSHETRDGWFETVLPIGGRQLKLAFPRDRFVPEIPGALLWLLLSMTLLTFAASLVLARQMAQPLKRLSDATVEVGRGEMQGQVELSGPQEIQQLTHSFNEMTQQLHQLLENRTTLLAGVSHDLRTPISRLTLALEMLPEDADPALQERMRKDLQDMDGLIKRALELARNVEKRDEIDDVDLTEWLDGLVTLYHHDGKPIEWQPTKPCICSVNVEGLQRVVTNLLENAFRYGQGSVALQLEMDRTSVAIHVLDNGPGIPDNQLEAVFQPFTRLEISRNQESGGSGLGLAIVQQIAGANGWAVTLENLKPNGLKASVTILM